MSKKTRIFVSAITSFTLILPLINCLCAIAADPENSGLGSTVSKTLASIIFILIFIVVSVISALLTYKIKRNKSKLSENMSQSSNSLNKKQKNQED